MDLFDHKQQVKDNMIISYNPDEGHVHLDYEPISENQS
jgi:hypothetical protein